MFFPFASSGGPLGPGNLLLFTFGLKISFDCWGHLLRGFFRDISDVIYLPRHFEDMF